MVERQIVPISAGVVCALVGFFSSFAVVIAGLRAVGATSGQAASGLLAVAVVMGLSSMVLAWRFRMPITVAWSTPGAAMLVTTGSVAGGWPAAIGAFLCCGLALVLTGLWPQLAELVSRIPPQIAQAMLAGVLLPICIEPVRGVAGAPTVVLPVLVVWLVVMALRPQWAVPAALSVAFGVIAVVMVREGTVPSADAFVPSLEFTAPEFSPGALIGVALPLYLVTMGAQNLPGVAVMAGFGYRVPWRPALVVTGAASMLAAPAGGHAVNLSAMSAALAAGPEAGPDKSRRWIAAFTAGLTYVVLGLGAAALVAIALAAPPAVIPAVAGVALIGAFMHAATGALSAEQHRLPAVVTFIVAASGVSVAGVGSAFWAMLTGLAMCGLNTIAASWFVRNHKAAISREERGGAGDGNRTRVASLED